MDQDAVSRGIKNGDEKVFRDFFNSHYRSLCVYISTMTKDLHTSEELVQDAFVQLWQKREQIEVHTSLKSYLYKIAYNNFLMRFRERKKQESLLLSMEYEVAEEKQNEDEEVFEDRLHRLKQAMEELPPACKQILQLRLQGYKYREIAKELQLSEKTVEAQLRIAYRKIREDFEKNLLLFFLSLLN